MHTKTFTKEDVLDVASCLKEGGLVAIPTDTVYGLAAMTDQYEALVQAKRRPPEKPFPLMVSNFEQIEAVADLTPRQRGIMKHFMPGAVTFVVPMKAGLTLPYTEDRTIGIRMADHVFVRDVIEALGAPIWLPSANLSGYDTGTNSDMVLAQLGGIIDGVVLGQSDAQASSSVFDLSTPNIIQYRKGIIELESILKVEQQLQEECQ